MTDSALGQDLYVYTANPARTSLHSFGGRSNFSLTPNQPVEAVQDDILDQLFGIATGETKWEAEVDGFLYRRQAQDIIDTAVAGQQRTLLLQHKDWAGALDVRMGVYRHTAGANQLQRVRATMSGLGAYRECSGVLFPVTADQAAVSGLSATARIRVKRNAADTSVPAPSVAAIVLDRDTTLTSVTVGWTPLAGSPRSVTVTPGGNATVGIAAEAFAPDAASWTAQANAGGSRSVQFTYSAAGSGEVRLAVMLIY